MIKLASFVQSLRTSLLLIENRMLQAAGLERQLAPALAAYGPSICLKGPCQSPGLLDGILWMAAPKKRRTIEVNRTRRRSETKLIKLKTNIEPCPECGHLKQKHILCGFCYAKVCRETSKIRNQIKEVEGGHFRAPTVETVVIYEGETANSQDKDKRIIERPRKRPSWFNV
uniref:Large ribosomal subunit protein bL32m n=1 Tax=Neogobius melanostomus TaxID=47308 RepID=A0A8C6SED8_9GOBI